VTLHERRLSSRARETSRRIGHRKPVTVELARSMQRQVPSLPRLPCLEAGDSR